MQYLLFFVSLVAVWVLMSMAANLVVGYGGLLSIGHVGLMAVGAYTVGTLMVLAHWTFWAALPAGLAVTAVVALVVIMPLVRLPAFYFGLATLAFNFIVSDTLNNVGPTVPRSAGLYGFAFPALLQGSAAVAAFCVLLTAAVAVFSSRVARSPFGLHLRCARDDEVAARSLGIDATRVRVQGWVLSGLIAGLAGALFVLVTGYLDATEFTYEYSIFLLVYIGVGGLGSVWGSIIGPAVLLGLTQALQHVGLSGAWAGPLQEGIYALVLIGVFLWRPMGILGEYDYRG